MHQLVLSLKIILKRNKEQRLPLSPTVPCTLIWEWEFTSCFQERENSWITLHGHIGLLYAVSNKQPHCHVHFNVWILRSTGEVRDGVAVPNTGKIQWMMKSGFGRKRCSSWGIALVCMVQVGWFPATSLIQMAGRGMGRAGHSQCCLDHFCHISLAKLCHQWPLPSCERG